MTEVYTHTFDASEAYDRLQLLADAWFEVNPDPDPLDLAFAFLRFGVEHGPGAEHWMFEPT